MILAYLINQYPQPSHTFIRREISALEAAGATVHRFTLRRSTSNLVDPADVAERSHTRVVLGVGGVRVGLAVMREAITRPGAFLRAAKLTQQFHRESTRGVVAHFACLAEACVLRPWLADAGVTHLHAHFGTNSTAVAAICRELGGPAYSFTAHGPEEFDQPVGLSLGEKTRRAAFAVTISAFGRSQLCRWCDPSVWPRIQVVRCGVDDAFLASTEPTPIPDAPAFVCVGRLEPQKGQLMLLDAVAKLVAEGVQIRVTLVGDGSLRSQIENRVRELGIADSVRLAGTMSGSQIRAEILASRAMVLPSFAEGLPVVLMEALGLGRPVVSTWVAGIPELVNASCGWLVAPGDAGALADALRQAIDASPEQLTAMGEAGRTRVAAAHDSATEAGKLLHLFAGPPA